MMKNLTTNEPAVLIKDVVSDAANDPVAKAIAQKVMSGNTTLCAPFAGMGQPWPEEKKRELAEVLARYAPQR